MQKELLRPYSLIQCFSTGFHIYRTHLIPILLLSLILLLPSFLISILELEIEHLVFFITIRLTEAAMTLGVLALLFQPIFPTVGILQTARTRLILGILHIAVLQFIVFLVGSMFALLQFPFNMALFLMLMISIFAFAFAQVIYIVERERGFRALIASFRLVQTNVLKTIATILLLGLLKLSLFSVLFFTFLPDFVLSEGLEDMQQLFKTLQLQEVLEALRWSQYLGYLVLYPFAAIVLVLLYIDLKLAHSLFEESSLRRAVAHLLPLDASQPSSNEPEDSSESL